MKIIVFIVSVFFSQHVFADCNKYSEGWASSQVIDHYTINNKSFFYFSPDEKNKSETLFLIKGDNFNGYLKNGNYTFGNYIRENGSVVNGWLKTQTLNQNPSEQKHSVLKLHKSDFVMFSSHGDIELGSSYEPFYNKWGRCEINKQPDIGALGNFIFKNDETYKYFDNYWEGLSIRTSNINHNVNGSDFNEYRITTISVTSNRYMTSRGVYIGMTVDKIQNAYGEPSKVNGNLIIYKLKNHTISFTLDSNIIREIIMDEEML